jgi:hypothetical protein
MGRTQLIESSVQRGISLWGVTNFEGANAQQGGQFGITAICAENAIGSPSKTEGFNLVFAVLHLGSDEGGLGVDSSEGGITIGNLGLCSGYLCPNYLGNLILSFCFYNSSLTDIHSVYGCIPSKQCKNQNHNSDYSKRECCATKLANTTLTEGILSGIFIFGAATGSDVIALVVSGARFVGSGIGFGKPFFVGSEFVATQEGAGRTSTRFPIANA